MNNQIVRFEMNVPALQAIEPNKAEQIKNVFLPMAIELGNTK